MPSACQEKISINRRSELPKKRSTATNPPIDRSLAESVCRTALGSCSFAWKPDGVCAIGFILLVRRSTNLGDYDLIRGIIANYREYIRL